MSKQYFIVLIKRKKKKIRYSRVFDIVVVKKHILNKVILEKIGSYDAVNEKLSLNFFRLIF